MNTNEIIDLTMMSDIEISLSSTILALFFSVISGLVMRKLYIKYGRSMNNREYFGNIFILLALTTTTVIIIVKYSLALSLGLVGALSIVRFRAAIKEPEELVFLFMVIALGLAFGANQFAVGLTLLIFSSVIIIVTSSYFINEKSSSSTGSVVILSGDANTIKDIRRNDLEKILTFDTHTRLKDVSINENLGRIVIHMSSNALLESVLIQLEDLSLNNKIHLEIVSDVSVPI